MSFFRRLARAIRWAWSGHATSTPGEQARDEAIARLEIDLKRTTEEKATLEAQDKVLKVSLQLYAEEMDAAIKRQQARSSAAQLRTLRDSGRLTQ